MRKSRLSDQIHIFGFPVMTRSLVKYWCAVVMLGVFPVMISWQVSAQPAFVTDSLKQELEAHTDADTVKLRILSKLASILRNSATSEALQYGHQALQIADSLKNPEAKASVLQILGLAYNTRMDYRNSLFCSFQALRIYESLNNAGGKAFAYNAIGLVYYSMKKLDMARRYYSMAADLMRSGGDHEQLGIIYVNIGNVLSEEHKLRESLEYYIKARDHFASYTGLRNVPVRVYMNIGETYADLGQTDSALYYLHYAISVNTGPSRDHYAIASAYTQVGKIEFSRKNIKQADVYLNRARKMAEAGGMNDLLPEIYRGMMQLYKDLHDIDNLFIYAQKYDSIKDNIYNETTVRQLNEMQEAYQVAVRDRQIEQLSHQQRLDGITASYQRTMRNVAIGGLLLLILVVVVVARNLVLRQHVKNRILSEKNVIAEKNIIQLDHENVLARYEAMKSKTDPHFLFNSLTTLSSLVMEDQKQAVKYIKQFSHLFRMLLETGDHSTITLKKELELVESYIYLQKIRFGEDLDISVDIPDEMLLLEIPPFALQMLIENAVKHNIIVEGEPFLISVFIKDGYIVVINTLRKKTSRLHSTSTGHRSVKERYRILSNKKPVFTETGTEYIVKLPLLDTTPVSAPLNEHI
jgi:tetratricopeptide (TPR) repeat protein